jgi:hypothetical protein
MVVQACNLERLRQADPKFQDSLGYIQRLCLKQSKTKQIKKVYNLNRFDIYINSY